MALLVRVDGTKNEIELPKKDPLRELRLLLDCDMIEFLPLVPGAHTLGEYEGVMSDEEARLTGKPVNELATKLSGRAPHSEFYHILGDCVFFKDGEIE